MNSAKYVPDLRVESGPPQPEWRGSEKDHVDGLAEQLGIP